MTPEELQRLTPMGTRIPGGCNHCDAYQVATPTDYGVHMTVYHDDDCPKWLEIQVKR